MEHLNLDLSIQVPLSDKVIKQILPLLQMLRLTRGGTWLGPDSCQLSGLSVLSPSQSQTEGKHSPVFVSCYLPPHVVKSICRKCFDALRDPDGVTIVSICPIVTRIDRSVVIFTPHMSVAWCLVVSLNIAWPGCRGQGLLSESPCHAPVLLCS